MLLSGCCPQWRLGRKWKEANRRWGIKWRPFLGSWALRPRMSKYEWNWNQNTRSVTWSILNSFCMIAVILYETLVFTETMDNLSMAFWVCSGSQISQYPMLQLHPPLVLILDLSPPHHKSQIGQWMLILWSPWAGTPPVYRDLPRSIPKPMYQGMPKIG